MKNPLKKAMDALEMMLKTTVTAVLIVFTVLVAVQVISRYVFHSPITWTEQAARYLFIWMIMLEMPVLFRIKGNMTFDLLLDKFPEKMQTFIHIVGIILVAGFAASYFSASLGLCMKSVGRIAVGIGLPINCVYAAQPVGSALLFLTAAEAAVESLRRLFHKEKGALS